MNLFKVVVANEYILLIFTILSNKNHNILEEKIKSLVEKIEAQPDDYILFLEHSLLLKELDLTKEAILSFRRAFIAKNPSETDHFSDHDFDVNKKNMALLE